MTNDTFSRQGQTARKMPQLSAVPKGALIMGTFLVGMSAIGVSAFAMRDQIFTPPLATTRTSWS